MTREEAIRLAAEQHAAEQRRRKLSAVVATMGDLVRANGIALVADAFSVVLGDYAAPRGALRFADAAKIAARVAQLVRDP